MAVEFEEIKLHATARCGECNGTGWLAGQCWRPVRCGVCEGGRVAIALPLESLVSLVADELNQPESTGSRRTGGITEGV